MAAQPVALALASDALVERVRAATVQAVQAWQRHWPLDAAVESVAETAGDALAGSPAGTVRVESGSSEAAPVARLWWPSGLEATLGTAMFGPATGRGEGTAARAARAAAEALLAALGEAWRVAGWSDAGVAAPSLSRWHAPLDVHVRVEGIPIVARVPAQRFASPVKRPIAAPLKGARAHAAFAALAAPVEVVVGQVELSVAELAGLQPGDVVLLDAALDAPLPVSIAGAPPALQAGLGRAGGRRAVEFVSRSR